MNAYLFTAAATRTQLRPVNVGRGQTMKALQTWSTCNSLIVCADNADKARKRFEEWLCAQPEGESPLQTQIYKMAAAQLVDQLLTETASVPLDWPWIARQAQSDMESVPADDFDQGYWVDVNTVFQPSPSLEALRQDLPEEIRSGLNWAEDKQFFFLISALSPPPPPPPDFVEEPEAGAPDGAGASEETAGQPAPGLDETQADFPELAGKEAAALIRARNSAVAAWLWRQYAADTELAGNQIRIDPWCNVLAPDAKGDPDAAIAYYTRAIELNPDDAMAYMYRGNAKNERGDLDDAIADYTTAIELNPDYAYGAYYDRANVKTTKGDYDGAIADHSKAIELKPDFDAAYTGRGTAKRDKGDLDDAIADFTKVVQLKPGAVAYFNRGATKLDTGDSEGAILDANKALEIKPDFPNPYIIRGFDKRGKGDLDGAMADYSKAIELNPTYAWAYQTRGCLHYDAQAFTDALADFRKALELDSSLQDYPHFWIWMIRARLGEAEAATAELQTYLAGRATGKPDDWESKIGRFLAGQLAEPEFMAAAKNAVAETEVRQLCQAYFYAGSKRLFAGDKAIAADYFQKSIATDKRNSFEYSSAVAELRFLRNDPTSREGA